MSRITILTPSEKSAFDSPPKFNDEDKMIFFLVDETLGSILSGLGSNVNRIGFLLQWGYFKACGRFFAIEEFNCDDVQYVCTALNIPYRDTMLSEYKERTFRYHQQKICQYFQYTPFNDAQKKC